MLSVTLVCVGRLKEKFYIDAVAEYKKRLGGLCAFSIVELQESGILEREAHNIKAAIPKGACVTAMCVEGERLTSEALAARIARWAGEGRSKLCFIIGGSEGLHESVKGSADLRLSMSDMTFPHHLARVMLTEQLYRAFMINAGTKYHK